MDKKLIPDLTIEEAASFYALNLCTGQDLVDFACRALERGTVSDSFNILAGEVNPTMSVIGPLFEKGLSELRITKPNKLQAQLNIAHFYAKAIKDGRLTPYQGACKIWWEISNDIENPSALLLSFVGAASEIEDLPERYENDSYDPTPNIEEHKKAIIRAADALLKIEDPSGLLQK